MKPRPKYMISKNCVVAGALGLTWSCDMRRPLRSKVWHSKKDYNITILATDWKPTTRLDQAVASIIPWLEKRHYGVKFDILGDYIRCKWVCGRTTGYWIMGEGSTVEEKMADCLCSVFLEVKEERKFLE